MAKSFKVKPGTNVRLKEFSTNYHDDIGKRAAQKLAAEHVAALDLLTYRLYAENKRALLIILQGMDAAGKDGVIRHVLSGVSPQTCQVVAFKQPTVEELSHDFLWRVHRAAPPHGRVGIFNRSHYEDVLTVRVHKLVDKAVWKDRFDQINAFEQLLAAEGTTIVKFFLHISYDEQRERLQARIRDPRKYWKMSASDVKERKYWDDYQRAYEDVLTRCSTVAASWHVIPADHRWYRNLAIGKILCETLNGMDPRFPPAPPGIKKLRIR
jgi:PPK2 family polyphosphate:nucleotide phosphotransferase